MREFFRIRGVFNTRNLVVMSLMVALRVVLAQFTIAITPQFKMFTLAYLPGAMVAALYGPWAALAYGFVSDTAGYLAKPMGPYFPPYALSEMLTCFIYACFTYKQEIRYVRVALARFLILVTVIFGLNFLWDNLLYGKTAGSYFTSVRLINNIAQFPVYVFLSVWCAKLARKLDSTNLQTMV